uniref:Uncharacterized protein n=1 Tax=Cacopsylla melanoneura TaxID=428564 RepID=A0A8D9EF81_9HEMI
MDGTRVWTPSSLGEQSPRHAAPTRVVHHSPVHAHQLAVAAQTVDSRRQQQRQGEGLCPRHDRTPGVHQTCCVCECVARTTGSHPVVPSDSVGARGKETTGKEREERQGR